MRKRRLKFVIAAAAALGGSVLAPRGVVAQNRNLLYVGPDGGEWYTFGNWFDASNPSNTKPPVGYDIVNIIGRSVHYHSVYGLPVLFQSILVDGDATGAGALRVQNNTFHTDWMTIGVDGQASMVLDEADLRVSQQFIIGSGASGQGTFTVPSTSWLEVGADFTIGGDGVGVADLTGSASAHDLWIGTGGTLNLHGGEFNKFEFSRTMAVSGIVNQSSGPCTVQYLSLGDSSGTRTYNLSGGTLTITSEEHIGDGYTSGPGLFVQTGGTHNVPAIQFIGGDGVEYQLKGGTLNSTLTSLSGNGAPVFEQTGGAANIALSISGMHAQYQMKGGVCTTPGFGVGNDLETPSAATFAISGGSVIATDESENYGATISQTGGSMDLALLNQFDAASPATFSISGGSASAKAIRGGALAVTGTGSLKIKRGGDTDGTSWVHSLDVNGGGVLDLTEHSLIVNYDPGSPSPIGTFNGSAYIGVHGMIARGRNGGTWDGAGVITSETAARDPNSLTSLGVAEAREALDLTGDATATWQGQLVDATSVLVMYTYAGDANLDGAITGDDYFQIDSAFPTNGHGWFNGDFNYDGVVNGDDYFLIDSNFPAQGSPFPTSAGIGGIDGVRPVPEPMGISVVAMGAAALLVRCRGRARRETDEARRSFGPPGEAALGCRVVVEEPIRPIR